MNNKNSAFRNIGRAANAREVRTCAMTMGNDGCFYLTILSQGFVVSVNLNTKNTMFCPFPDGYKEYPYGSLGSKNGKVYFGAGKMFYEFDPQKGEYTFAEAINKSGEDNTCEAWAPFEASDGMIYFGAVFVPHLTRFNPETRELTEYGIMSEKQKYLTRVAVDKEGWIYCGMGMESPTVVAFNPSTREKRVVLKDENPGTSAEVFLAKDGEIYGTTDNAKFDERQWYRLCGGESCGKAEKAFDLYYEKSGFDTIHCPLEEHPEIIEVDLPEHEMTYIHPDTKEKVILEVGYEVDGADMSPITAGSDGKVYGTTNHPISFFTYDPKSDELINYGRRVFDKRRMSDWGNICAYAKQGNILGGAAYCGGLVVRIDVNEPISREKDDVNPHCEGAFREVLRPRSAAAMPDNRTMVFGGFNVYAKAGGGLIVYDSISRTCDLIKNEEMLQGQSVLAIVPLSKTRILCGTSIEAPSGGEAVAEQAEIFEYDIETRKVIYRKTMPAGVQSIEHMKSDAEGMIHGITGDSTYFVYSPDMREVLHTQSLSEYGVPVRDGMAVAGDGAIYGLLTQGIYKALPGILSAEIVAVPPCTIESGMAIIDDKIYFADITSLWSYSL